jgi:uncharacterized protein YjbI with pentapeptide repeats
MTATLKQLTGNEFITKILSGERDFSGVKLEKGFDFNAHDGFDEMQNHLSGQPLQDSPVIINGSDFSYVKARGLYLPFSMGGGANLYEADLRGANLYEADLRGANLLRANLLRANFWGADLRGADFEEADFEEADFEEADLRGVRNLAGALNLDRALFYKTKVTKKEKAIIERALISDDFFDMEGK